jgi:hypothetical protein
MLHATDLEVAMRSLFAAMVLVLLGVVACSAESAEPEEIGEDEVELTMAKLCLLNVSNARMFYSSSSGLNGAAKLTNIGNKTCTAVQVATTILYRSDASGLLSRTSGVSAARDLAPGASLNLGVFEAEDCGSSGDTPNCSCAGMNVRYKVGASTKFTVKEFGVASVCPE